MKRKTLWFVLGTCLAVLVLCHGAVVAAEKEPAAGHQAGNVAFSAPITAEETRPTSVWPNPRLSP